MKTKTITVLLMLTVSFLTVKSQNLLKDGDFESSVPNGTWPSSGVWRQGWYPHNAGAVTTSTAAIEGKSGLWIYTSYGYSFSRPCQEFDCEPLKKYKAQAWLRSPWNQQWTKGTKAFITISFLDNVGYVIKSATSDTLRTGNTGWELYSVIMTAPKNAKKLMFELNLESTQGQSILNADNCVLSGF